MTGKIFWISDDFVRLVENKGYSMFHLISEDEYNAGLTALKKDFENKEKLACTHGETLLWFKKEV